jgi:hypothetical protein
MSAIETAESKAIEAPCNQNIHHPAFIIPSAAQVLLVSPHKYVLP